MAFGQHHLHARRGRPHSHVGTRVFDQLMYGIGLVAPLALLPQVYQVYVTHSVDGLSLISWTVLGGVNAAWAVYGYIHKSGSIFAANLAMALLNFAITAAIVLYR